jgi:hypothetical protein
MARLLWCALSVRSPYVRRLVAGNPVEFGPGLPRPQVVPNSGVGSICYAFYPDLANSLGHKRRVAWGIFRSTTDVTSRLSRRVRGLSFESKAALTGPKKSWW